ncbi:hypothetical protein ABFX02_14G300600 [Erythranthe guttata]
MEAIRKQASKLREQVAKQQQAVLKQFVGGSDNVESCETEIQLSDKLEKLCISTRAAKHFQRDVVRGIEGLIVTGSKQIEIGTRLSEDGQKYGSENTCTSGSTLSNVALTYSKARAQIEKEHENLLKLLRTQVTEPLRDMIVRSPLEDARRLAKRYDRVRQETESQAIDVARCQSRARDTNVNSENMLKLEAAERKLYELKSNMLTLGKEASAAMAAVESQQQRLTLHRLIAMVEAERAYHQRVLQILDKLELEMLSERQRGETTTSPAGAYEGSTDGLGYFLGEVIHPYRAESDAELTLAVGDYIVVREVRNDGWAEGECKGKAGWFPYGFIVRRKRIPATEVAQIF